MNKIYKVMYSKVKQCCVVVSEIASDSRCTDCTGELLVCRDASCAGSRRN